MIQLSSVSKRYSMKDDETVSALSDVTLSIGRGEFIAVIGASGSGKSTLLFTVAGMLAPTEGSVMFDGDDLYSLDPGERASLRKSRIGFVFQTFNLIPYLTCLENVALPAVINGNARSDAFGRAEEMLCRIGLGARIDHKPPQMSVGERQRAAVLRSMINDPEIILADEPTGNLDGESTREVMDLFREVNGRGKAVVMVTHNPECAKAGQRVLTIRKGALEENGAAQRGEAGGR